MHTHICNTHINSHIWSVHEQSTNHMHLLAHMHTGADGSDGLNGEKGEQGIQGKKGEAGLQGPPGPQGMSDF